MLRVETSFQDSPGDGYYFVLYFDGRRLAEQLGTLGLRHGDSVMLWESDCDLEIEAVLLFDFLHPVMLKPELWARDISIAARGPDESS